jgi:hypothetical protein
MRRFKKEIKDKAVIIDILNRCHVGCIGTIGKDGYPMVKPLNFAYYDGSNPLFSKGGQGGFGSIYFHTAKEGEKIEYIKRDNKVCFEAHLPIAYLKAKNQPCEAEYFFRSVIIKGRAYIIEDRDEKLFGLKCLMEKYQPEGGYGGYLEEKLKITGIVRIDIEEMVGKEDIGKTKHQETVLKALEDKVQLPIALENE